MIAKYICNNLIWYKDLERKSQLYKLKSVKYVKYPKNLTGFYLKLVIKAWAGLKKKKKSKDDEASSINNRDPMAQT